MTGDRGRSDDRLPAERESGAGAGGSEGGPEGGPKFALWGSRFRRPLAPEAAALNRSLPVDIRLWREELAANEAWAEALEGVGVLTADERRRIVQGLAAVGERLASAVGEAGGAAGSAGRGRPTGPGRPAGAADPSVGGAADEDVHTLVERLLGAEVGELAGKLPTGRSRNDQVATIARMWAMRAIDGLDEEIARLQAALLGQAEASLAVILPGYTHLQRGQPIRMAHFFLSHFWPLARDRERWADARRRAAVSPLGSGALAGSGFPVDREALADRLGFRSASPNSLDAVSDRDFVAEFAFAAALTGAHLSRLGEDLILFSSAEFGFVAFDDAYSTGSSLMPQKRNPDIAELARGRSARLMAEVTAALGLLKGLPSGYNKDLQDDKAVLFGSFDALHGLLPALAGAVETLRAEEAAAARALEPAILAVDVADALVRTGAGFREAHGVVGSLVRVAESEGISILEVDPAQARELHPALPRALEAVGGDDGAVYERSVEARTATGGTARARVEEQLAAAREALTNP